MESLSYENVWIAVASLNNLYEVSNRGEIRNAKTKKLLRQFTNRWGYRCLVVRPVKNKSKNVRVHVLVAEAFLGPRLPTHIVHHKDGNKHNNTPENLEYVTYSENNRHALESGLRSPAHMKAVVKRGEESPWARITEDDAKRIIAMRRETGFGEKKIAKLTGFSVGTVSGIITNRTWKHLRRD